MQNAIVITGRLVGPTSVQLDEPVSSASETVEVIVRGEVAADQEPVSTFLRRLPPGTRTRAEIDQQVLRR